MVIEAFFDDFPEVHVLESEYKRLLGYPPDYLVDGRSKELMDKTRSWYARNGRPWISIMPVQSMQLESGAVHIEGQKLNSGRLYKQYERAKVRSSVIAVVSAGPECEQEAAKYWKGGAPDEYFFMEMFGSAVAEYLISAAGQRICTFADQQQLVVLPHYSPGYTGWDIIDQMAMMRLIQQRSPGTVNGRIDMMSSGMLRPKKSQVGLFGLAQANDEVKGYKTLNPCVLCALPNCAYRRKLYRRARQQNEQLK